MSRVLGLIGTGLIGGSIGLALRERGWHVVAFDVDPTAAREGVEIGAVDENASRADIYANADIVVIAAPVDATLEEVERVRTEQPSRPKLLMDVASVKGAVASAAAGIVRFVPTHPMAGSERTGVRAARADLFQHRTWAYVDTDDREAVSQAIELIVALGALPVAVDPTEHDRVVALTSHVPQLVATAFSARVLARDESGVDPLCGPAARELLRLGRSDFSVWRSILTQNAANVAPALRGLAADLNAIAGELTCSDFESLEERFECARGVRASRVPS